MIILKFGRKPLIITTAVILLCSIGFNIYSYRKNVEMKNRYQSVISNINKFDKTGLTTFLNSADSYVQGHKNVEIFNIKLGKVIKKVQSNTEIQKEAKNYLKDITGMYVKVNAFPNSGFIIRIPFEPAVKVQNKWLNDYNISSVNEMFVLFPENAEPYLLVLDEYMRPLFYNFKGNTDKLLKILNFK